MVNRLQANNGLVICSGVDGLVSPDYSVFDKREPLQMKYLSDLLRTSAYRSHFRPVSTGLGTGPLVSSVCMMTCFLRRLCSCA